MLAKIKEQPTFLVEGGGHLVCSNCSNTIATIVKSRIDIWGKHKAVYKTICTPNFKGYMQLKQLRRKQLAECMDTLDLNGQITIICATDKLDMLTIKIRRIRYA